MKNRFLLIMIGLLLMTNLQVNAQSEKRLVDKTFVPYQWEIYNTIYKRRYWDFRDNYDYVKFDAKYTFERRYQGTQMSGTWKYDKKNKTVVLSVTKPFKKEIILKVEKLSRKELTFSSSEEEYKVKMFMKEGEQPTPKRRSMKQPSKATKKKKN